MALPELPDDRRATKGRHSRGEDAVDQPPGAHGSVPPRGQALPATSWPIDGGLPGARHSGSSSNGYGSGYQSNGHGDGEHYTNGHDAGSVEYREHGAHVANGRSTNGHSTNGYGANGHGVEGFGADEYDSGRYGSNGAGANGYDSGGHSTNGHGTNGHGTNGHGANGHGANGHGANGHGANGHGAAEYDFGEYGADGYDSNGYGANDADGYDSDGYGAGKYGAVEYDSGGHGAGGGAATGRGAPDGRAIDGRSTGEYAVAAPVDDFFGGRDAHVVTPPYSWAAGPSYAPVPAPDGLRGRHSAGPVPEGATAHPDQPGDGWDGVDAVSTMPNGRPLNFTDDTGSGRFASSQPDVLGERAGHRHVYSDVPPPRRVNRPAPSEPRSVEPAPGRARPDPEPEGQESSRLPTPQTWLARVRSGDLGSPDENQDARADPATVAFDAIVERPAEWRGDGPGELSDHGPGGPPHAARDVHAGDLYAEQADDGPAGFPGKHRRRAGEPKERSGPSLRDGPDDDAREDRDAPDDRAAGDGAARGERASRKGRGAPKDRDGRMGRRRRSSFWKELPILIVVALVLTFLIQTFLAKVYVIPSGSMETTLHGCTGCNNDRVLVDKVSYRFSDPAPGDVVVFRGPDGWTSEFTADEPDSVVVRAMQSLGSLVGLAPPDEKDFIKRVIAVGGQTVQCCDSRNRVLVDGKPLDETYLYFLPEAGAARQDSFGPVTVPAGELWVMGDSRNNSADSRVPGHGPVPSSDVIGRARLVVLPFGRFGAIPSPDPQTAAVGMAANTAGVPAALSAVALLPLALLRRRTRAEVEFLPRRRT